MHMDLCSYTGPDPACLEDYHGQAQVPGPRSQLNSEYDVVPSGVVPQS